MTKRVQLLTGSCERFLFSTGGQVEGVMIKTDDGVVQVVMHHSDGTMLVGITGPGKRLRVLVTSDHIRKADGDSHPVFEFESLADAEGQAIESKDPKDTMIKGVVKSLHFSRRGKANGVVLETGEFIHLRPHNMAKSELSVGATIGAIGDLRMTILGTRMLEARHVNSTDAL